MVIASGDKPTFDVRCDVKPALSHTFTSPSRTVTQQARTVTQHSRSSYPMDVMLSPENLTARQLLLLTVSVSKVKVHLVFVDINKRYKICYLFRLHL